MNGHRLVPGRYAKSKNCFARFRARMPLRVVRLGFAMPPIVSLHWRLFIFNPPDWKYIRLRIIFIFLLVTRAKPVG
jgi:hypothetical protein